MAAAATLLRPRPLGGPAVRPHRLPARGLLLSAIGHAVAVGGLIAAAVLLHDPEPTRTYVVTLAPAVPAQGSLAGRSATLARPAPAPAVEPPPPTSRSTPAELPRETAAKPTKAAAPALPARDVTAKSSRPTAAPELPDRVAGRLPDMPARGREREMPKGQKELPSLSGAAAVPSNLPRAAEATRDAGPPPPPPSLGRPTGAPQGVGAVPSVEGDFPYQWYLTAVQRKVYEQWTQPLSRAQLQKVVIVFEIARNGEVARARVEKTSGDAAYDLAALRAVAAANPLPPLPAEFRGSVIRVHFGFEYSGRG